MKQQDSIDTILFSIGQTCDMCNVTLVYYKSDQEAIDGILSYIG